MDVVRDAAEHMKNPKTLTMVIYALYAASYITLVSGLAGIILNYLKRNEVADSWVATHFNWQIHTFWISLGVTVVGIVTTPILIGFVILFGNAVWVAYRLIKGFIFLYEDKPLPNGW